MKSAVTLAILALAGGTASSARAQTTPDFYAGKSLRMIISVSAGGGYDQWGRLLARHMGGHLPGRPNVVAENMPGAGSLTAANYIYNLAPKDGTAIGIVARDTPLAPLRGVEGPRFDARLFSWIGTPTIETNVCIGNKAAKAQSARDLLTTEMIVGSVGRGSGSFASPKALSGLLGMKFRIIPAFPGSPEVFLAMERGEVDGYCESLDSVVAKRPEWIAGGKVNVLFQAGLRAHPSIPAAPLIRDLATTPAQLAMIDFLYAGQGIGRPFIAPPGLPPERLRDLRAAFDATLKDPAFLEDARKLELDIQPVDGAGLEALVKSIYATPKEVMSAVGDLVK